MLRKEEAAGPKAEDEKMKQDMKQQNTKEEEKDVQKMDKDKKIESEEKVK